MSDFRQSHEDHYYSEQERCEKKLLKPNAEKAFMKKLDTALECLHDIMYGIGCTEAYKDVSYAYNNVDEVKSTLKAFYKQRAKRARSNK